MHMHAKKIPMRRWGHKKVLCVHVKVCIYNFFILSLGVCRLSLREIKWKIKLFKDDCTIQNIKLKIMLCLPSMLNMLQKYGILKWKMGRNPVYISQCNCITIKTLFLIWSFISCLLFYILFWEGNRLLYLISSSANIIFPLMSGTVYGHLLWRAL